MFVAFAGGGAKGLIHLGALRALEARKVEFRGLGGTSAGAIVAALKAAGFTADDLLDLDTGQSILKQLSEINPNIKTPADFFGGWGWKKIRAFRKILPFLPYGLLGILTLLLATFFAAGWLSANSLFVYAVVVIAFALLAVILLLRLTLAGLARTSTLSSAIGILLQRQMFPNEPQRVVVMEDFGREGRPTLKIVSANLSRARMQLFSPELTPKIPVSEAIAASISLPIIFEPLFVDNDMHMDGGIVSNLPAWSFDEERELDPDAITLAVEIETATERRLLSKFNWLTAFIQTGLFGSSELNLRAAGRRSERLALSTSLNLLQFDLTATQAIQEVRDAERAAVVNLDNWLFRRPETYRDACKTTKALVDDVLETALGQANPRVRVAIATPDKGFFRSLRLRYSTGSDSDFDEDLLMPVEGTVVGQSWLSGDTLFEVAPLPNEFRLDGPEHRLRRKVARRDLKWVLCVPISNNRDKIPQFVVQIDGGIAMPPDGRVGTVISRIEDDVKEFFGLLANSLDDLEGSDGLEK